MDTATRALLIAFTGWYKRHAGDDPEHAAADELTPLLGTMFEVTNGALRTPTAEVLENLVASLDGDLELEALRPQLLDALEHYLDFAVETGSWPGTDAQIAQSADVLERAYELTTGLLPYLLDALNDIDDVPAEIERAAFEALTARIRSSQELADHLRTVLDEGADSSTVSGALALERVLGVLSVAAYPALLPGLSTARVEEMLDVAAGVTAAEAREARPATDRILAGFEFDGILRPGVDEDADRLIAAPGLRPALADALIDLAEEWGLLTDDEANPHPDGTALQVKATIADTKPAEWRRLLFAADADFGELHLALQLAFDWSDSDPHEFTLADEPGTVLTTVDLLEGLAVEDALDEDEVELGELFVDVGDEVLYRYGQDDVRRLVVRLERIVESSDQVLPRCVGASAGIDVGEADRLLSPLRLR